jgi:hypothetical protein
VLLHLLAGCPQPGAALALETKEMEKSKKTKKMKEASWYR